MALILEPYVGERGTLMKSGLYPTTVESITKQLSLYWFPSLLFSLDSWVRLMHGTQQAVKS